MISSLKMRWFLPISLALLLASCSPIIDTRGHNAEAIDLSQIIVGQSSAEDVTALLGSPTTTSNFGDEIWYYVTQKQARVGVFAPEVTEQHIIAVQFGPDKKVAEMGAFTKEDGKPVQIVSKTTPTEGHSITFMEQILGNLGRFNAPARNTAANPRNVGR